MKPIQYNEITGREAINRRDALENYITARFPIRLQRWVSAALTGITGLAPGSRAGRPVWAGSELRALLYLLIGLVSGALLLLMNTPIWMRVIGALAVISSMRSFTSAVGHQLTHSAKGLPWPGRWTRVGYDVLSAILILPSYERYSWAHGIHHGKVGGPGDPDQEMLEYLGARMNGFWPFVWTLLSPTLHALFLALRLRSVFGERPERLRSMSGRSGAHYDPAWRRLLAAASLGAGLLLPFPRLAAWGMTLIVGYQMASYLSAISLHLWYGRPESGKGLEVATAVTFGRLLIPEANWRGVLSLPVYALVRAIWLQSDLSSHDIHHAYGTKYPWTEAAYVRTRLLLEGVPLRQTVTVRAMFEVAFESAKTTTRSPIDDEEMLGP